MSEFTSEAALHADYVRVVAELAAVRGERGEARLIAAEAMTQVQDLTTERDRLREALEGMLHWFGNYKGSLHREPAIAAARAALEPVPAVCATCSGTREVMTPIRAIATICPDCGGAA
jgi:hypothetical protein